MISQFCSQVDGVDPLGSPAEAKPTALRCVHVAEAVLLQEASENSFQRAGFSKRLRYQIKKCSTALAKFIPKQHCLGVGWDHISINILFNMFINLLLIVWFSEIYPPLTALPKGPLATAKNLLIWFPRYSIDVLRAFSRISSLSTLAELSRVIFLANFGWSKDDTEPRSEMSDHRGMGATPSLQAGLVRALRKAWWPWENTKALLRTSL